MIEIYGKPNCVFCERAKKTCDANDLEYEYYNVIENESLIKNVEERMGRVMLSVPQIFIDGEHVGGFTEFAQRVMEMQ